MQEDFATGAIAEIGGSAVGWGVKTSGRIVGHAGRLVKGRPMLADVATDIASAEMKSISGKHWARLKELVPADTPIPAPRTVALLNRLSKGRWSNEVAEDAAAGLGGKVMSRLRRAYKGEDAWMIQHPKVAGLDVDVFLQRKGKPGWDPVYVVFDDGKGILAFRHAKTGSWKDGTKPWNKGGMLAGKTNITRWLGRQNLDANPVGIVPAEPVQGGGYALYLNDFQVSRVDAIPFQTMNDLMANTTSAENFGKLKTQEARDLMYEIRDAIREDIRDYSVPVRRTVDRAFRWGRRAKTLGAIGPPAAKAATKGLLLGGKEIVGPLGGQE
jgi:hypothetical protein